MGADEAKTNGNGHRRDLDGLLLLDKPQGITSNAALRAAQRLYGASKAGHTGTLDPLATGLLPVCFGEASKFSHVLLDAEKTYLARLRLGVTTTTGDLEGEVTARAPVSVTRHDVDAVLPRFVGEIMQIPPMYSAIKVNGQPLYKLARAGLELPRMPRKVIVRELALLEIAGEDLELMVACSKGTYIRVLAEDIGRELGCGACVSALRRTAVGGFTLKDGAVTLAQLEALTPQQRDGALLPPDALVATLPRFDLDADQAHRITRGQALERVQALPPGLTRIYGPDSRFLGIAEVTGMGRVVPRRLRAQEAVT
jgi:tRNA pseudouridine55 synthase